MTRRIRQCASTLAAVWAIGLVPLAAGQTQEELAANPKLFLATLNKEMKWEVPAGPTKVVGPIYFVGTMGLSSWLITTPRGHVLLNTGMPSSGPMIADSIRQLGFSPEEIRIIIFSHAHVDHVGAVAFMKKLSGASVLAMEQEAELLQSGGALDFQYGQEPDFRFEPVKANRLLHDGDRLTIGDLVLTPRLTPGHTKGTTTWTTRVMDGGKGYNVVFPDGTSVNPGYRLTVKPSYPDIEGDYWKTFGVLESIKPDIWLAPHTQRFGFEAKRARAVTQGPDGWVDPEGYRKYVAEARQEFEAQLKAERAAAAPSKR